MKVIDFQKIKFFSPNENWGDLSTVKFELVKALDDFRAFIGTEIQLTAVVTPNHTENSQHFTGHAADVMFPNHGLEALFGFFRDASRFPAFTEIGVYSNWTAFKASGGLHVGVRPQTHRDYWFSHRKGLYEPLNVKNMLLAGLT